MLSIFPLLGLSVFDIPRADDRSGILLHLASRSLSARGYEDPRGFLVLQGSQASKVEHRGIHRYMSTLRQDLLSQGVLVDQGDRLVFTQDHVFTSPSTASGVINGRTANGRLDWRREDGVTLKEIQEAAARGGS